MRRPLGASVMVRLAGSGPWMYSIIPVAGEVLDYLHCQFEGSCWQEETPPGVLDAVPVGSVLTIELIAGFPTLTGLQADSFFVRRPFRQTQNLFRAARSHGGDPPGRCLLIDHLLKELVPGGVLEIMWRNIPEAPQQKQPQP